jgi:hypothetical protein
MLYTVLTVLASLAVAKAERVATPDTVLVVPTVCCMPAPIEGGRVDLRSPPPTQLLVYKDE